MLLNMTTRAVFPFLACLGCYVILNLFMNVHYWLGERTLPAVLTPSNESALAFLLLAFFTIQKKGIRRLAVVFIAALLCLYLLFAAGEAIMLVVYQRSFNPWIDVAFISVGLELLFGDLGPREALFEMLTVAAFAVVSAGVATTLCLGIGATLRRLRIGFLPVAILSGLAITISILLASPAALVPTMVTHLNPRRPTLTKQEPELTRISSPGLRGRNVYLFFVESYGYTILTKPALKEMIKPTMGALENQLLENGYFLASSLLDSPVSGGWSWIAEASFLTGKRLDSQLLYEQLLESESLSIPRILNKKGYFTLLAMPANIKGDWPEGVGFYDFDDFIFGEQFRYAGPVFSYVPVPDQYTIYKTFARLKEKIGDSAVPAYVQFALVSSHAPFNRIPVYIPDWDKLGDGSIYHSTDNLTFDNNWITGKQYDEGYAASINYVLTTLGDFLTRFEPGEALVIIVGDHQPKRPVREKNANRSVLVHVLSRSAGLIDPFYEFGFTPGFIPEADTPHDGIESFYGRFLAVVEGMES